MTPRTPSAALACALAALLPACSNHTAHLSLKEMRKHECRKNPDLAERARCEQEADRAFESYRAEPAQPKP